MEGWDSYFLGQLGASAALGGLLFVAISINLDRILKEADLPNRALLALLLLLTVLTVSGLMLIPGQPLGLIGAEVLVLGAIVFAAGTAIEIAASSSPRVQNRVTFYVNAALFVAAVLPYLIGGVVLLFGGAEGVYWIAAAIVFSVIKAVIDAWVLLVEIQR